MPVFGYWQHWLNGYAWPAVRPCSESVAGLLAWGAICRRSSFATLCTVVAQRDSDHIRVAGVASHRRSDLNNLATHFHFVFAFISSSFRLPHWQAAGAAGLFVLHRYGLQGVGYLGL